MRRPLRHYIAGKPGRKPLALSLPARSRSGAARPLNNLVTELLSVRAPMDARETEYRLRNPRDGWVYVVIDGARASEARVYLDGVRLAAVALPGATGGGQAEYMRELTGGEHMLALRSRDCLYGLRVTVRAIPELIYATYPANPGVASYGPYDWQYLANDVLRNANVAVVAPDQRSRAHIDDWRISGRRAISEHGAAWIDPATGKPAVAADEMLRILAAKPGMTDPGLDGMILDTHDVGHGAAYMSYADAIRRLATDPHYKDRRVYLYCDCLFGAEESQSLARAAIESGYTLAWTRYLHEQPTLQAAREYLEGSFVDEALGWRKYVPGSIEHMVVALGYLTSPGERMNIDPGVDYRVFMDMQCRLIATHTAFRGLRGVMWYKSGYADDDAVRWAGRLFRHYFIEGGRSMLSRDPYVLPHIVNPDFDRGTQGWTLSPAQPGSITAGYLDRYGFQQGRWLETAAGDRFLLMRRSATRPNSVWQTARRLQPGRLYSVEFYTADYAGVMGRGSGRQIHAVSIAVDNAVGIPRKSFQHPYPNWPYYHLGPYDDEESTATMWINYHRYVFRANSRATRITIYDWETTGSPGGPVGQELMLNFVEVQPYLE